MIGEVYSLPEHHNLCCSCLICQYNMPYTLQVGVHRTLRQTSDHVVWTLTAHFNGFLPWDTSLWKHFLLINVLHNVTNVPYHIIHAQNMSSYYYMQTNS